MEPVSERIRQVRTESGMSVRAFAAKIGIGGPAVSLLENGRNNPSEQTIRAICKEFSINREWLETGKGPMHASVSDDDFTVVNEAMMKGNPNKIRLFRLIADMPDDMLNAIVAYFQDKQKDLP